jgi:hypothetical protein
MLKIGGHVDHILIWPLGGLAIATPTEGNVLEDFWAALVGKLPIFVCTRLRTLVSHRPLMLPLGTLTHVPLIIFWIIVFAFASGFDFSEFDFLIRFYELKNDGSGPFLRVVSMQSIQLNVLLIIFNLLVPAYPLDASRCVPALLVHFGVATVKAASITAIIAIAEAAVSVVFGIYVIVVNGNVSGYFFVLIAIFVLLSSADLLKMALTGCVFEHAIFDRPCYRRGEQGQNRESHNYGPLTPLDFTDDIPMANYIP